MKIFATFTLLFILATSVSAEPPGANELFRMHCASCHGVQGTGDGPASGALEPPPRNLTQRPYKQGCGPGAIVGTLKSGVEGSAMPSFSSVLSDEEMWVLARYVRSLQNGCCGN